MALIKRILNKLNGMHFTREYICLPLEQHTFPLHALLVHENKVVKDISAIHLMVGICPLIIALPVIDELNLDIYDSLHIIYTRIASKPGSLISKDAIIASLEIRKIQTQKAGGSSIYYYEGVKGKHWFIPMINQVINHISNNLYNKKGNNIFLEGNLYTQLQVAYSIPKLISLITVESDELFNMFPTDQHGQINNEYYIIALRQAGNAARQVEAAGKITISNVSASNYKEVYKLGKNHMQPLKEKSSFDFSEQVSQLSVLPLPRHTLKYRELELADSFIHGIHKIFLFKILFKQDISGEPLTLSCIHNAYATWRLKCKLPCDYFLV